MSSQITDDIVKATLDLGDLIIQFAKVKRATHLDLAGTKESDTDHTVMLSVIACAIAQKLHPEYDIGKVSQYALVHDIVEVYAGDVSTIDHNAVDHKAKQKAEALALKKITEKFGKTFPWLHQTINQYESLQDPESRFVKTIDKVMPGILQHFSGNKVINEKFDNPEDFEESMKAIDKSMEQTYASDQQTGMQLRKKILKDIIKNKYEFHGIKKDNK
jgi:5'-deoxynucleotidase YfbR-like HD superfamily hydrolase